MPRGFALGPRFESLIDAEVRSGRYNNASEVARDASRLFEDRDPRRTELRRPVAEGAASGLSDTGGGAILDRLESKYRDLAALPTVRCSLSSAGRRRRISRPSAISSPRTIRRP